MHLKYPPLDTPVSPAEKIDVQERYKLPIEVQYCARCVVSNQRPRIVFDDEGVCNACRWWETKDSAVDWADRERRLVELCDRFRRDDGSHDVVVPASGGKDSCLVAHMLKYEYGMNPLTVTWSPHIYTEIGWQNLQAMIHSGLDNVLATPNGKVHRLLTRYSFEELGEPFQPFIYGQIWYPVRVAAQNGIQLIFDGENGELEYGGDPKSDVPGFSISDAVKYWLSDHPLEFWYDRGFSKQDLYYYSPPDQAELEDKKIERHFFSYYKNWRPQDNYYYAQEHCGFEANPLGRSEATYSKYASLDDRIDGFHFYLALMKFGISRATSDAAHEIREGLIEREEAVALVQRYDTEFPGLHFEEFLAYCDITEDHFWDVCDRWRNENLWEKRNTGWELKVQVS
jgi:N-acetyl sugar amidotransferase